MDRHVSDDELDRAIADFITGSSRGGHRDRHDYPPGSVTGWCRQRPSRRPRAPTDRRGWRGAVRRTRGRRRPARGQPAAGPHRWTRPVHADRGDAGATPGLRRHVTRGRPRPHYGRVGSRSGRRQIAPSRAPPWRRGNRTRVPSWPQGPYRVAGSATPPRSCTMAVSSWSAAWIGPRATSWRAPNCGIRPPERPARRVR